MKYVHDNGLPTRFIQKVKGFPTGYVDVTIGIDGCPSYEIYRPAAYDFPSLTSQQISEIIALQPDWLYFGTVQQTNNTAWKLTRKLFKLLPKSRRFYDMNLRGGHYTIELVKELLKASSILKLNNEETQICCQLFSKNTMRVKDFCKWVVDEFDLEGVCVTMGSEGCTTYFDGEYLRSQGCSVEVVDPVGAGDAFAAGFLHGLSEEWELRETCNYANHLGALIAGKIGAIPEWSVDGIMTFN